ncbi:MAG: hypothetical protein COA42_21500 [Alteromonadaceae bacterium]|nr:MAG: hypothetical protein COA42_21500 [Alteromonadaceae bacterium]
MLNTTTLFNAAQHWLRKTQKTQIILAACLTASFGTCSALAETHGKQDHKSDRFKVFYADNVTGSNQFRGKPLRDFGADSVGSFGFYNVAAYNPDGDYPLEIDENTPNDALMASAVDPIFASIFGLQLGDIDPTFLNVPLRDVKENVSLDGKTRMAVKDILEVDQQEPSQAHPSDPITLGDWIAASGKATVSCKSNGTAKIAMYMKDLIPNRIYTVWALYATPKARPLGGSPNVFVTDGSGNASWKRVLNFCPMDKDQANPLLQASIVLHTDHQTYGDLPGTPTLRNDDGTVSLITGAVSHSQLEFAFRGELIDQ